MIIPGMTSMTWTEYVKNSKLYGIGKKWPNDWSLLINTGVVGTEKSLFEKCYFEKCVAYFKHMTLWPLTEDDSITFTIFLLTCFYVREHDNFEFEHIHRHVAMDYSFDVVDREITLVSADFSSDKFRVKAILIEPYKGKEDDISIEYYPEKKRYHSHVSIADLGIKYSMSFDYIGQKTD